MNILVIGSGGREHALCWSLAASPAVTKVFCAPGNAGIADVARCVDVRVDDLDGIVAFARERGVGLVVVGPELPLVLGLVDRLEAAGIKAFGPTAAAARLEGSKAFTKAFCARHGIPTAAFRTFSARARPRPPAYVGQRGAPIVVKADGLAAGKGVVVAATVEEALAAVDPPSPAPWAQAGETLVIEEFLEGEEASLFALCDGTHALEIGTAQDHKRAFDGDRGPNTGGMGAYSPAPMLDAGDASSGSCARSSGRRSPAWRPRARRSAACSTAGLMLTADGPKLIEYNVRFGDPECQAVLPRLMTDLAQLLLGAVDGVLGHMSLRWLPAGHALTVVMASRGLSRAPTRRQRDPRPRGAGGRSRPPRLPCRHPRATPTANCSPQGGRVLNVTGARRHAGRGASSAPTRRSTGSTGRRASAGAT